MKWENKGHEYDDAYSKLRKIYQEFPLISIFGCGDLGKFYAIPLQYFGIFGSFYDNHKAGKIFQDVEIKPLDTYAGGEAIVLCASSDHMEEMRRQLRERGLVERENFWEYTIFFEEIFPIWLLYEKELLYARMIQLSLTERCMLNCIKCAHACNYVSMDEKDLSDGEIQESIDHYFSHVDFVQYFLLIGGEPLMSSGLRFAVEYIGKRYRERIGQLQITTNGVLIPDKELISRCKKHQVFFRISNYTRVMPGMQEKLNRLTRIFDENALPYCLLPQEHKWTDYGFDFVDRNHKDLQTVFDSCKTECHEIRRNKLYFCIMARSVAENTKRNIGLDDCLELSDLEHKKLISKKEILEYLMGYSEKGYLEMCNYCNGSERSKYPILAAEQERKKERTI